MKNRLLSLVSNIRERALLGQPDEHLDRCVRRVAELYSPHDAISEAQRADYEGRYRQFCAAKERFSGMPEKYVAEPNLSQFFKERFGEDGCRLDVRLDDGRKLSIVCADVKVGRYDISIDGESAGFCQNKRDGSDPILQAYEVFQAGEAEQRQLLRSAPRG